MRLNPGSLQGPAAFGILESLRLARRSWFGQSRFPVQAGATLLGGSLNVADWESGRQTQGVSESVSAERLGLHKLLWVRAGWPCVRSPSIHPRVLLFAGSLARPEASEAKQPNGAHGLMGEKDSSAYNGNTVLQEWSNARHRGGHMACKQLA